MKIKKETTVAVIIGLILALLVTGGILRARHALRNIKLPNIKSDNPQTKVDPTPTNKLFLEITTPDNSVSQEATMILTGTTLPDTYIAILGEKAEYLIIPNDVGSFSQEISLVKGVNTIKVTVYQADGNKAEKTISTVYTTAEI